eukprot:jgi/Chrzof1/10174/Cz04g31200.t1
MLQLSPTAASYFIQVTVAIQTKQIFAAYSKSKRRLSGDPNKEIDVCDYWVLENKFLKRQGTEMRRVHSAKWRLAARLLLNPQDNSSTSHQQQQAVSAATSSAAPGNTPAGT